MKFLFIINTFYPDTVASSAIVMNLSEYLISKGHQVDVLCLRRDELIDEFEEYNKININRIIDYDLLSKKYIKSALKNDNKIAFKLKISINYVITKLMSSIQLKFTNDNIITKRTRLYRKKIKSLLANGEYKAVISVNGDLSSAVAAAQLKKQSNNFKYIHYQVDPYTNNYVYEKKYQYKRLKIEKEIFKYSDGVIMPSSNYLDVSLNAFTDYDNKINIIEFPKIKQLVNIASEDDIHLDGDYINIVYTGILYEDIRNPKYVLKLFSNLDLANVKLYFVGCTIPNDNIEIVKTMGDKITVINRVSQQAVSNLLLNADILVNIGNSIINTFPSKLFEYFSSGKPIINFYKSTSCPTLNYTKRYPNILDIFEDNLLLEENINKVRNFINFEHKDVEFDVINNIFFDCTVMEVGKRFEKILTND